MVSSAGQPASAHAATTRSTSAAVSMSSRAEAAVNAVYANKIAALPPEERDGFVADKRAGYERDIDLVRLASELVVDAVVAPRELRAELIARYALAAGKDRHFSRRRHGVTPV